MLSDLVIADLSTLNPNVFYEIGLRHMLGKAIIHVADENTKLPFDVSSFRTVIYDIHEPEKLEQAIKQNTQSILDQKFKPVISDMTIPVTVKTVIEKTEAQISRSSKEADEETNKSALYIFGYGDSADSKLPGKHVYNHLGQYIGPLLPKHKHPMDIVDIIRPEK